MFSSYDLMIAFIAGVFVLFLPIGLGLIILFSKNRQNILTNAQTILFSYVFGLMGIVVLFTVLERLGYTYLSFKILIVLVLLSAIGLYIKRDIFIIKHEKRKTFLLFFIGTSLIVLASYIVTVEMYSDYPVINLFSRVHYHASALSFSNYDIINPFYASSYIQYQGIILGLLSKINIDALSMEFVLPITLVPLIILSVYVVAEKITNEFLEQVIIIWLFLLMFGISNLANSAISEIATLLFISLLLNKQSRHEKTKYFITKILLSVLFLGFYIGLLHASIYVLTNTILLLIVWHLLNKNITYEAYFFLSMNIFLIIVFHRAGLMFVPIAIFIYFIYRVLNKMDSEHCQIIVKYLGSVIIFLLSVATLVILFTANNNDDVFGLWKYFDLILKPLLGKSMFTVDENLAIGSGSYTELFEVARSLSFFVFSVAFLFFIFYIIESFRKPKHNFLVNEKLKQAMIIFLISLILLLISLSGFPFMHRISFLINLLVVISFIFFTNEWLKKTRKFNNILIFLYLYLVSVIIIAKVFSNDISDIYLQNMYPVFITILIVSSFILIVGLQSKHSKNIVIVMLLITIFSETVTKVTFFKRYGYMNQAPTNSKIFSHYSRNELDTVNIIAKKIKNANIVLISDPKSMALLEARTGLPPIFAFSNLNTMSSMTEDYLRKYLKSFINYNTKQECSTALNMLDHFSSGANNYNYIRHFTERGDLTLKLLGYNNALVPKVTPEKKRITPEKKRITPEKKRITLLIVISKDTLTWLEHPENFQYFPTTDKEKDIYNLFYKDNRGEIINNTFFSFIECNKTIEDSNE